MDTFISLLLIGFATLGPIWFLSLNMAKKLLPIVVIVTYIIVTFALVFLKNKEGSIISRVLVGLGYLLYTSIVTTLLVYFLKENIGIEDLCVWNFESVSNINTQTILNSLLGTVEYGLRSLFQIGINCPNAIHYEYSIGLVLIFWLLNAIIYPKIFASPENKSLGKKI